MSKFSIGQMNKLGDALEKAGFSSEGITRLTLSRYVRQGILEVLSGRARFVSNERHTIDCSVDPRTPADMKVWKHEPGGYLPWDPASVALIFSDEQKGWDLYEQLKGRRFLNACVLDFLLDHRILIPEDWKDKRIYFMGTLYEEPNRDVLSGKEDGSDIVVRTLMWEVDDWKESTHTLHSYTFRRDVVAVLSGG